MRILEPPSSAAEKLSSPPLSSRMRAGQAPRDRVEQHHRGQLAAREDVRADRDGVRRDVLDDALVEALEAGREERQALLAGELLDQGLVERPALGVSAITAVRSASP